MNGMISKAVNTVRTESEFEAESCGKNSLGGRKFSKASKKQVAKGLLLLGGAICLSRGHSSLGAKVVMAYILTKLSKRANAPRGEIESRNCIT